MLPLLLNKIIQTDKLLFLHLVTQKNRIYTFLNPVSYLIALENKSLFEQFDGIFADGSLLVSAIRLVYGKRVTRRSFDMTSLAPELLNYLMESRKTLYIVASGQEQVECSVRIFQEQYPELRIAGFRNGYFSSDAEMNKEASHIVELNPDFLIVGMGALMQEKFLLKVKKMGYQGIGFTCGGFVHQTAMNRMHYYPNWVDKMNLRFVYRMYKEKHTRTRYLQAAFLFPVRFIGEKNFRMKSPISMEENELLRILEDTLIYVPSSTNTEEHADISLYDHMKMTGATAAVLMKYMEMSKITDYKEFCFTHNKENRNKDVFLMISGDFSGIQKFIYHIRSEVRCVCFAGVLFTWISHWKI